jgi:hypothetical protein
MVINKVILDRLKEVARNEQTVFYGSIADLVGLDIHSAEDRKKIGRYLDDIDRFEYAHGRPMLSSVVIRERTHCPGKGFFALARQMGLQNGEADMDFFTQELKRVHAFWRSCAPDDDVHA